VVNPAATTTSARAQDVIARALGSDLKLDVAATRHRGHACELARQARRDGFGAVIALGGDGTVNEVVNGLLADGLPRPYAPAEDDAAAWEGRPGDVPLLGVVPGGSTNVFARAVGLAASPIEATSQILDAVREGRHRKIGLGKADDRYFTFCAGFGMDAEVISRVEHLRARGRAASASLVLATALQHFFLEADRRSGPLSFSSSNGVSADNIHTLILANTAPWTYLGTWPVNPTPHASFDGGLDVVALRSLGAATAARYLARMLSASPKPLTGRSAQTWHDLPGLVITADRPTAFQLDGEALGVRESVRVSAVPAALSVLV
jgi:diacylglycerol kinase family enzyme